MDWFNEEARFAQDKFNATEFVRETFAEDTVEEAALVRKDLLDKKNETASELINLVKKNYFQFLDTANESARIETELSGLRSKFVELRENLMSMKSLDFGFELRQVSKGDSGEIPNSSNKESEVWKQRVQYVAEAELELDVLLSERRLESAVALLEQAQGPLEAMRRKINVERLDSPSDALTLSRIENRIAQVADALTMQLTSPAISASEARIVFGLLKRMHMEAKAKEVFLAGRSQHNLAGIKQLKPDADRVSFIRSLSRQVFVSLHASCSDYIQCFGEAPLSLSHLSVWCVKEVRAFGNLWIRFVISRGEFEAVVTPCLVEALACVRILEEFGFYMEKLLRNQLLKAVVDKYERIVSENVLEKMRERAAAEDWYALPQKENLNVELQPTRQSEAWLLTPSAVYCINSVHSFVSEAVNFLPPELIHSVSDIGFHLLEKYFSILSARLDTPVNDAQLLGVLGNAVAIVSVLGKKLDTALASKGAPPKFDNLMGQLFSQFCLHVCDRKAHFLLYRAWQFSIQQYASVRARPVSPTRQALKLFEWITMFQKRLVQQIAAVAENAAEICRSILTRLLVGIVELILLADAEFWSHVKQLTREAVIQFCLDLRWIQEASSTLSLSTPKMCRDLDSAIQMRVCGLLVALLVLLVGSVPPVLPGSLQTNNFAGLCENTYFYPDGYTPDKCGRCELTQDAGRTCDCPVGSTDCFQCPESPILTGLLLCRLDVGGYTSLPLDSEVIEQAFLEAPTTLPQTFGYYALYYPGLQAPKSLDEPEIGILDCFCIWGPLGGTTTRSTTTAPRTTTSATTTRTTLPTTTSSTLASTSTSTATSTTSTTTASTTTAGPTTTPTEPTISPQVPCTRNSAPCGGVCPVTGYDCVFVDGFCGCRRPCGMESPLGCGLGYCNEGFACALTNSTCGCQPTTQSVDSGNVELLPIIGVPIVVTVLAGAFAMLAMMGNRAGVGAKHKPNSYI